MTMSSRFGSCVIVLHDLIEAQAVLTWGQVTLQDRYIVHDGSIHGKQFLTHPNQLAC